jgi:hypothetical protein
LNVYSRTVVLNVAMSSSWTRLPSTQVDKQT